MDWLTFLVVIFFLAMVALSFASQGIDGEE